MLALVKLVFTHGTPSLPSIAATSVTADFHNHRTPNSSHWSTPNRPVLSRKVGSDNLPMVGRRYPPLTSVRMSDPLHAISGQTKKRAELRVQSRDAWRGVVRIRSSLRVETKKRGTGTRSK